MQTLVVSPFELAKPDKISHKLLQKSCFFDTERNFEAQCVSQTLIALIGKVKIQSNQTTTR